MQKKILCVLLSIINIFLLFSICADAAGLSVSASSAIVMNADTCEIVFSKKPYDKRGIASTTKIMTSLVALEYGELDKTIKVSLSDVNVEGTSIGLKEGDVVSLKTLVAGMLLESGNDAANVTATLIAGDKNKFSELMNKKAKELGMNSTNFKNPSGLTEDGHYSTAYDMAILSIEAIKNKTFLELCSLKSFKATYGAPPVERTFFNHNKFLNMFDGALGIKTGFTKASGRCLVTAAKRDGATFVAVTLNARDDWKDHIKMMEYAFSVTEKRNVEFDTRQIKIPVVGSEKPFVNVTLSSPLYFYGTKEFKDYEVCVYVEQFLYPGVKKGDYSGWVELRTKNGKIIMKSYILCADSVSVADFDNENVSVFRKILNKIKEGLS